MRARGKVFVGKRHEVTDRARGNGVVREKRDITFIARGRGRLGVT